jgi:hypothetical protein
MFNDYDGKHFDFMPKNRRLAAENTNEEETQTENDLATDYADSFTQTALKEEKPSQTNLKEMLELRAAANRMSEIDPKKLETFLNKAYTLVNSALMSRQDEAFEIYDEEIDNEDFSAQTIVRIPCISNNSSKFTKISDICWNSSCKVIGISYYSDNHLGPCSHTGVINFLTFESFPDVITVNSSTQSNKSSASSKSLQQKFQTIETNSCIKCIDSHPKNPNHFIAGSFIGEIYLINLELEKDQIMNISPIDSYFHKETVIAVKYIPNSDSNFDILSLSEEGRLLIWGVDDKLQFPKIGYSLKFKINKNTIPINPTVISVVDFYNYLVGTIDGNIYKCSISKLSDENYDYLFNSNSGLVWRKSVKSLISNMNEKEILEIKSYMEKFCRDKNIIDLNPSEFFKLKPDPNKLYKNALKSNFEKHISIVTSIEFNPFLKNLFLSCSYDGSLRLYHQNFFVLFKINYHFKIGFKIYFITLPYE